VTTDHLTDRIWFRDDDDFKAGMNITAVLASATEVNVLSFELMSNHVHFVLSCSCEQAERFIEGFKKRYAQFVHHKYGTKELLRRNGVDIQRIDGMDESLERAIAYVQMNCVAANICVSPVLYPWGSGDCFFSGKPVRGSRLGSLSRRAQKRLIHSTYELPEDYLIGEDGYILPSSYVQVGLVENVFRTPRRMNYFLQNSSKAKRRLASNEQEFPAFRDQIIVSAIPDLCQSLFRKSSPGMLDSDEQAELLKQLRFRFSSNVNQLARVTDLPYEIVTDLLDSI